MKNSQLVEDVVRRTGMKNDIAAQAVEAILAHLEESVAQGDTVTLGKLGRLSVKERAARAGRNPQTGEAITIPARKAVVFHAGKSLVDLLNPR